MHLPKSDGPLESRPRKQLNMTLQQTNRKRAYKPKVRTGGRCTKPNPHRKASGSVLTRGLLCLPQAAIIAKLGRESATSKNRSAALVFAIASPATTSFFHLDLISLLRDKRPWRYFSQLWTSGSKPSSAQWGIRCPTVTFCPKLRSAIELTRILSTWSTMCERSGASFRY